MRSYWSDAPTRRVYSANVYRQAHYAMQATDRLEAKHRDVPCDCDLDFVCAKHEHIHDVAERYARMREAGVQR